MLFTNDEAKYLIGLPKQINNPTTVIDLRTLNSRLYLVSEEDPTYEFLVDIKRKEKIEFKISIHNQEDISKIGLLRVDYKGRHKNPATINDYVSEIIQPYAGTWIEESHIHYFVEGYNPLDWAIPLSVSDFPIKEIDNSTEFGDAILAFSKAINIVTKFQIQDAIL